MAQSKKTGSGAGRKTQGKQLTRRAQRRAQRDTLGASLVLCALGILFLALILVKGTNIWQTVRGWVFGTFGILTYLVGPLLLYLGYLVASGYLVGKFSLKVGLMAILCGSVPVVFSAFTVREETALEIIQMLFTWSQNHFWSGGVLGGLIGAPLLALCGRPAANVLLILVFAFGLMMFFAITPVDVVQFTAYYWQRFQQKRAEARAEREEYDVPLFDGVPQEDTLTDLEIEPQPQPAAHREPPPPRKGRRRGLFSANPFVGEAEPAPAPQPAPEPAAVAVAPAPAPHTEALTEVPPAPVPRASFDVDLGPDPAQQSLQNAVENDPLERVIIGPGGTFGLDPLKDLGKPKPLPTPQPVAEPEFEQHIPVIPEIGKPAAENDADLIDELIQKAINAPARGAAPTLKEDAFDTALEPAPAAPAAPVVTPLPDSVYVGDKPAPYADTYDAIRSAWNSGVPVAEVLGTTTLEPAATAQELLQQMDGAKHAGGHTVRYRARPAGQPAEEAAPAAQQPEPPLTVSVDLPGEGPAPTVKVDVPEEEEPYEDLYEEPKPYAYPSLDLFNATRPEDEAGAEREMRQNADVLVNTLDSFGVKTNILDICRGPSVTRYELQPQAGIKVSRITSLSDDIALNLATAGVRIEAPIPGKPAVGIEVPNKIRTTVNIRNVFESQNYINMRSPLTMALGKDIAGVAQVADLCRMPHLLIAGSTGSGKSVCVNSIIISFLFRSSPEDVKLILIDPKVVELAEYNGIPHLLMPVVTEPRKAAGALGASVQEMERRYKLFADNNVREIKAYNKLAAQHPGEMEHLPYIAIVIDELADLMMVAGKEVEDYICRIAQKARAAGIHLIVATQRPSVDVITGLIKANIPSRVAFAVSSQVDSRTILDGAGAEKLLGNGDMLFLPVGAPKPVRVQGTFVTDEEIAAVLNFIKSTSQAQYDEEMIAEMERRAVAEKGAKKDAFDDDGGGARDAMFDQAVECVIEAGMASTSLLQRKCKLGYARAARIMDQMEKEKIIGPYEGAKPRSVLITLPQWQERKLSEG